VNSWRFLVAARTGVFSKDLMFKLSSPAFGLAPFS
jgi:hypothetical protein